MQRLVPTVLLLSLVAACAPKAAPRRAVQLVAAEPSARPAPSLASSIGEAGPWYQRRAVFDGAGPARRPEVAWRVSLGEPITQSLTTDGGAIYAVSGGTVHAIGPDGDHLWSSEARAVGPVSPLREGPAVATSDGVVLALDPADGRHAGAWVAGDVAGLAVPLNGDVAWVTVDGAAAGGTGWVHPLEAPDRSVDGPASTGALMVYTTAGGKLVVASERGIAWTAGLPGPGIGHPVTDGDTVVAAYGAGQGHAGGVIAYRLTDAYELWRWALALEPAAAPAVATVALVPDLGGQLNALDLMTGELLWRTAGEGAWSSTPAIGGMGAFATEVQGRVTRIDLDDGGEIWSVDLKSAIAADPVVVGDTLVVGLANGDVVGLAPPLAGSAP
jgi:outer membrane protein assembly factor BamB